MKNYLKLFAMLAFVATFMACGNDDDPGVDPDPDPTDEIIQLTGELSTQTLTADNQYLLVGQVFVRDGQTLTIEPGTVIFGDKRTRGVLVIDRGGKIMAEGTPENPIVFTSNQEAGIRDRGDWGGVVILGRARTNQVNPAIEGITPQVFFGGDDDEDNSGIMTYTRIEFGGIELTPNNETNSLTMGGVGRGTKIDYCQVSFGGDDGFEWFGGSVNHKYLISTAMWDDDYDVDFGYSGNVQFGLAVRYPGFADQSTSNGFECDNGPNDNDVTPYTTGTFSNMTIIGPIATGTSVSNSNFGFAMDLRRRTAVSIVNSVLAGFPTGLRFNQESVRQQYLTGEGVLSHNILFAPNNRYGAGGNVDGGAAAVQAVWEENNETINEAASSEAHAAIGIKQSWFYAAGALANDYPSNPDFTVTSGSSTSGASFDLPKFSEANRAGFFTTVAFRGAFGATDWTDGWAEFDPVDREY